MRMEITNVAGGAIKPRLPWHCRGTNGGLPDTSCGDHDPARWDSPDYLDVGETWAITSNPAISHQNATTYFYDYHFQWEVLGQGGLVDTRAFDGDYQSAQFDCPGAEPNCVYP